MQYSISTTAAQTHIPAMGNNVFEILSKIGYDACDDNIICLLHIEKNGIYTKTEEEFTDFFSARGQQAKNAGIAVAQIHAPFPTFPGPGTDIEQVIETLKLTLYAAYLMGAPYMVVHPAQRCGWEEDDAPERTKELNYRIFSALLSTAEQYHVRIALENMPAFHGNRIPVSMPEEWRDYVDMMQSTYFCACFDTGHAHFTRYNVREAEPYTCDSFVRIMGSRIQCLHIHDNTGFGDEHTAPGGIITHRGIDWEVLLTALRETGYHGVFSLETDCFARRLPETIRFEAEQFQLHLAKSLFESRS